MKCPKCEQTKPHPCCFTPLPDYIEQLNKGEDCEHIYKKWETFIPVNSQDLAEFIKENPLPSDNYQRKYGIEKYPDFMQPIGIIKK